MGRIENQRYSRNRRLLGAHHLVVCERATALDEAGFSTRLHRDPRPDPADLAETAHSDLNAEAGRRAGFFRWLGIRARSSADVERRFALIDQELRAAVGSGISVGLAALARGEMLDDVMARADAALLAAKRERDA